MSHPSKLQAVNGQVTRAYGYAIKASENGYDLIGTDGEIMENYETNNAAVLGAEEAWKDEALTEITALLTANYENVSLLAKVKALIIKETA